MIGIKGSADVSGVLRDIERVRQLARSPRVVLRSMRTPVRRDQMAHGRAAAASDGAWPKRAAATVEGRGKKRAKIRRRRLLGKLSSAIKIFIDRSTLTVQSMVKWSAIHQHGGIAGRGARIPRREFLWFSPDFLSEVRKKFLDYLTEER